MEQEHVILVDSSDRPVGTMEKMEAHLQGFLHRAFSIFVFNTKGELLIHQRALDKYHSGGLWTNTCCSHPRPGESSRDAANRRLLEEMGMTCDLEHMFKFKYRSELDNNLIENEYDHVFFGVSDALPVVDSSEVESWKYMSVQDITSEIERVPHEFTEWFKICFPMVAELSSRYYAAAGSAA